MFGLSKGYNRIGNKVVTTHHDDLIIESRRYENTKGLWNLLMNMSPSEYKDEDLLVYVKILHQANTMKRRNNPNANIVQSNCKDQSFKIAEPFSFLKSRFIEKPNLFVAGGKSNSIVMNELISISAENNNFYRQKPYEKLSSRN